MPGNNFLLGLRVLWLKTKLLVYKEKKKNDRQERHLGTQREEKGKKVCFNLNSDSVKSHVRLTFSESLNVVMIFSLERQYSSVSFGAIFNTHFHVTT